MALKNNPASISPTGLAGCVQTTRHHLSRDRNNLSGTVLNACFPYRDERKWEQVDCWADSTTLATKAQPFNYMAGDTL